MLKNIRLHLDRDEQRQQQLEQQLSADILQRYERNRQAFLQHIPSLAPFVKNLQTQNISIFCNQLGQTNIVDYGTGRTFYGLNPEQEVDRQYQFYREHCPYMSLSDKADKPAETADSEMSLDHLQAYQRYFSYPPLKAHSEVVVVFGLGLARHIERLLTEHHIDHLIIYEPEVQYFQSAALAADWQQLLELAKGKNTTLYIQLGKDGRDLVEDISELTQHVSVNGFYLYQHYHHPVFDSIRQTLADKTWPELLRHGINYQLYNGSDEYLPPWTAPLVLSEWHDVALTDNARYQANLAAFEKYFPDIYQQFKQYRPQHWLPIQNNRQDTNLLHKRSLTSWYGDDPRQECLINFQQYSEQPNKDGLVLGYNGEKLKHYVHYQFVNQTQRLLDEREEAIGHLPDRIKSLIMFGIGSGYQLEALFEQHDIEKLFICEPNRDFFYGSLFAIDWATLLQKVDESEARIYINVGDDGSHLFRDLVNQFYSIGPYILANTYFYQSYYNASLNQAIAQLREQLQVVISMGEYYDHARYGIAQTQEIIRRGYPFLTHQPARHLTFDNKDVPIFIIGNGPSLDSAINTIKEYQHQAIVVSCGTSLQVLHRHGIVPDFHAEVEQNRSTFDWCCRIDDFDYLKQIALLSCNGIHPDTCDLFKQVYVAFKEGESSTISALSILGEQNWEKLKFAFPTVSNFVVNVFTTMAFKQLYLFGVDLGFVDNKQHHSKHSGYYGQDGKELYDYAAQNNTALQVPGNFRSMVFTKHEFKVSKTIIEESLAASDAECFNCSDGAQIAGSMPLQLDNVLIVSSKQHKQVALQAIKQRAFNSVPESEKRVIDYQQTFSSDQLAIEIQAIRQIAQKPVHSQQLAERLIERQKSLLFASYQTGKSLLFYLLYGTVNYANAVFSKLANTASDDQPESWQAFEKARNTWMDTLQNIDDNSQSILGIYDYSTSFTLQREQVFIRRHTREYSVAYGLSDNIANDFSLWFPNAENQPQLISLFDCQQCPGTMLLDGADSHAVKQAKHLLSTMAADQSCDVFVVDTQRNIVDMLARQAKGKLNVTLVYQTKVIENINHIDCFTKGQVPLQTKAQIIIYFAKFFLNRQHFAYVIPKLLFTRNIDVIKQQYWHQLTEVFEDIAGYIEFPNYLAIVREPDNWSQYIVDQLGNRGVYVAGQIKPASICLPCLTNEQADKITTDLKTAFIAQ